MAKAPKEASAKVAEDEGEEIDKRESSDSLFF